MSQKQRTLVLLLAVFAMAPAQGLESNPDLNTLLTLTSEAESTNCLRNRAFRSTYVLNKEHVLFIGSRAAWINKLPDRCAGLRNNQTLVFDGYAKKICASDTVQGRYPQSGVSTGRCPLGPFIEIEKAKGRELQRAARKGAFD